MKGARKVQKINPEKRAEAAARAKATKEQNKRKLDMEE